MTSPFSIFRFLIAVSILCPSIHGRINRCPRTSHTRSKCTRDLRQVQCGENKCLYDNICKAVEAGFEENSCCPFSTKKYCGSSFSPVTCWGGKKQQQCTYPNFCSADASGFHRSDCINMSVHSQQVCGKVSWDSQFKCMTKPNRNLQCGPENCVLRNVCEAREMGWSKSQCTKKDGCRLASNRKKCKDRYKPVRCGPQSCKYQNMCVAKSAGYKKTECEEVGIMISS
mmetsp:Transcript_6705/g.9620  ORF Transcript_6705/g.9620 Transcript_6705/m.9620 type:complete len:227 (-) Transcript_6705:54-734(-)